MSDALDTGGAADSDSLAAGISVRQTPSHGADIVVQGDTALLTLHRRLLEAGLETAVVRVLTACGDPPTDHLRQQFSELGIDALDGHLSRVFATAATAAAAAPASDPDTLRTDGPEELSHALTVLSRLGDGTVDGLPSTRADLDGALPPLFAGVSMTPTVTVRLGVSWASCRRAHRERVLQWLTQLALGVRVDLVVGEAAARRILADHRADVPAHILTSLRNRGREPPAPLAGEATVAATDRQTRVADAMARLDRDGRPCGVLQALARTPGQACPYQRLARELSLESPPYEAVRTLAATHGLVERTTRADGTTVVSLRPAGLDVVRRLSTAADIAPTAVQTARADGGSTSAGISDTPQNPPAMPYSPAEVEGGTSLQQTTLPEGPTDQPPAADATATTGEGRLEGWQTGLITPEWAPRSRWVPAAAATSRGELGLVSADLDLAVDRDGRTPAVSWSRDRDLVYVGAEYHNPMQAAATLAHGLTSELLWSRGEFADRIGDGLAGLAIQDHEVLRNATRIGWLPNSVTSGADLREQLRDAREELLLLSRELAHTDDPDDRADLRSELAATALGLVGVVVQLFDLADIEVVLDYRIADLPRHFSADGNPDRRADLVAHLRKLTTICSRAGAWTGYAQLLEHRTDVRADGWSMDATPGVDVATPVCGLLIHGGGVDQLADDVAAACRDATAVHPDAPPLRIDIDVRSGTDHHHRASTARRMLRARGLQPTCTATAILAGMVADPFALATAIHWGLERESPTREIYLDEVRRVLATASPADLLPDCAPSARAGIAALARAEEPLSQATLCRRADITAQSWRTHRAGLVAADWIRETPSGWRLALPFRHERHADVALADPPWWLRGSGTDIAGDLGRETRRETDVLEWLLFQRGLLVDLDRIHDATDPIGRVWEAITDGMLADRALLDCVFHQLGVPPPLIRAGCGVRERPDPTTVQLGAQPLLQQTTLPVSDTPQNSPTGR